MISAPALVPANAMYADPYALPVITLILVVVASAYAWASFAESRIEPANSPFSVSKPSVSTNVITGIE